VLISHFQSSFIGVETHPVRSLAGILVRSPLRTFFDGGLQVQIFFVLSGFVIANAAARRKHGLLRNVVVRYIRLTVPASASVAFSLLCLWIFPNEFARLRAAIHLPWIDIQPLSRVITLYGPVHFSLRQIIHDSIEACFSRLNYINTVLWTMKSEFFGSCSLYCLYALIAPRRARLYTLLAALLLLFPTPFAGYIAFIVGAILFEFWQEERTQLRWSLLLLLLGVIIPCELVWWEKAGPRLGGPLMIIAATSIVYICLLNPIAIRFMSARPSRLLGRISFPLYLVHYPILCSFGAYTWLHIRNRPLATVAAFIVTVLLSLLIAFWGEVCIDAPTVRALRLVDFPSWPALRRLRTHSK
jgi:peptidoglycan/LPS O-acetylase OafA/YrhL